MRMATLAALETATPHALLRLPYPEDALAPIISARTVGFHHGKHHKGYVDKVNELVAEGDALRVVGTASAEVPFTRGQTPLVTIDVGEHAYYLDYQNRRADYAQAVVDKLLNWEFAAENLARS